MAPPLPLRIKPLARRASNTTSFQGNWRVGETAEDFILESWSQGFLVGALLIMACITIANMRRGVWLHKFILVELLMAMAHGTFCFMAFNGYDWYLSSTASLLYLSWIVHNIVSWMKIRPFFVDPRGLFKPRTGKWVTRIYLTTLAMTVPPILLQIVDNFLYFNDINPRYTRVRPYETFMRDPWWVSVCITLFHIIRKCYTTPVLVLIKQSPRFGILLVAIFLAMSFTVMDVVASFVKFGTHDGINPYWKLSLVFKCLTDTIMLDDFKTELKRLGIKRLERDEARRQSTALILDKMDLKELPDELEFSDPLSTNRIRDPGDGIYSYANANGNGSRRSSTKHAVGKVAVKIAHLPALGKFQFPAAGAVRKTSESRPMENMEKEDDLSPSQDVSPRPAMEAGDVSRR